MYTALRGKREVLGTGSSHLLKSTGIDVAELGISAETQSVQQEVTSATNAVTKDIFKSVARRSISVRQDQ